MYERRLPGEKRGDWGADVTDVMACLHTPHLHTVSFQGLTYQLLRLVQGKGGEGEQPQQQTQDKKKEKKRQRQRATLPGQPPEPADPLGSLMFLAQLVESAVGCLVTVRGRPFR